jgi:hypothetical protein
MSRSRLGQAVALALAFAFPVLTQAEALAAPPKTHSASTIGLLAIDADPNGNTATSLGAVDGCARVEPGSTIDVDYVVDAIPQDRPMIGFEAEIRYDPGLLEAIKVDSNLLIAAVGTYSPLALSDALPDSDGKLRISVLDTASSTDPEANVERGPGVLVRVTFRAKATGLSTLTIGLEKEPLLYPLVLDTQDEMILADRIGGASVAIGRDCPPEAIQPQITDLGPTNQEIIAGNLRPGAASTNTGAATTGTTPGGAGGPTTGQTPVRSSTPTVPGSASSSSDAGDGSDTLLIAVVAVLLALGAAVAGGGWYLYQRYRHTSGSD